MNPEFKIVKLELENYRQYYGLQVADFSSRDDGFSVFLGENGEGKSNLLNAINWCLYKTEPHKLKNKTMPIINMRYLNEINNGEKAMMKVTLHLKKNDIEYKITRRLQGIKHEFQKESNSGVDVYKIILYDDMPVPAGFEVYTSPSDVAFLKTMADGRSEDQTIRHDFTSQINNEILPLELAPFFLLDGEFMEKLFVDSNELENGVKEISQLNLIDKTLEHAKKMIKPGTKGRSKERDELIESIQYHQCYIESKNNRGEDLFSNEPIPLSKTNDDFYHTSGDPRIKDLDLAINKISTEHSSIVKKIGETGAITKNQLYEKQLKLNKEIRSDKETLNELRDKHKEFLITIGPKLLLKKALSEANGIISYATKQGHLPTHTKIQFTSELLSKKICICGTKLTDGSDAQNNVMKVKNSISEDADLDIAIVMKYRNISFLNVENNKKEFDTVVSSIPLRENALSIKIEELKTLQKQMMDSTNNELHKQLLHDEKYLNDLKDKLIQKRSDEKNEIESCRTKLGNLRHTLTNIENKDTRDHKKSYYNVHWENVVKKLSQLHDELKTEIREQMQQRTTEIFQTISWKKGYFKSIIITPNYKLILLNKDGWDVMDELSAGERLLLALSFIAALRINTGYMFPLIVDTPLGRISGTPRILLANTLPDCLPNSQITLLATDTEHLSPIVDIDTGDVKDSFRNILKKKINIKEFRIKLNENEHYAEINNYVLNGETE